MSGYLHRIALMASFAAALILSGCGGADPVQHGDAPLNAEEMKSVLVGNTITGDDWDGPFAVYFPVYGEMRGLRASHYKDIGTWRVEEAALCATWDNWWGALEKCWGVYLDGDTVSWLRADSDRPQQSKVLEGNSHGL